MECGAAVDVEEIEDLEAGEKLLDGWIGGVTTVDLDGGIIFWCCGGGEELAGRLEGLGGGDVLVEVVDLIECICMLSARFIAVEYEVLLTCWQALLKCSPDVCWLNIANGLELLLVVDRHAWAHVAGIVEEIDL